MQRFFTTAFLVLAITGASMAQNLQLHYDFGKAKNGELDASRNYFTTTFEMFRPDNYGHTYTFVDFDYNRAHGGAGFAYWEIARTIKIAGAKGLGIQIEYNDGTADFLRETWLFGLNYPIMIGNFFIGTSWLYRADAGQKPNAQFTAAWGHPFWNNRLLFAGFVDVWTMDKFAGTGKDIVFLSEPQLWLNLTKNLAIGSEVEFSYNFFTFDKGFEIMPTVALKWNFDK